MKSYKAGKNRGALPRAMIIVGVVLLVLLIGSVVVIRTQYYANLKPVSATNDSQLVTVQSGATANEVAVDLQKRGLIRASWAFEWYLRSNSLRDKLMAGSYYIRPNMSVQDVASVMTQGKVATDLFTILPGQRLDQVKKAFVKAGYDQAAVDAAFQPSLYKNHPALVDKPVNDSLEGYLYPDSFQKTANTKPETIIRASLDEMQRHLTPDVRAGFVAQGLTVHQGVMLASIVEKEVSRSTDRAMAAQVFLLRLKKGMPLGSDVTAFYGSAIAGKQPDVTYDSPYNTRIHSGMPAGPISNVSESSLKAVAFPASTDYLFFVAGDDGVTYYSHTLQEHEALTAEHCKKLCE